MMRSHKEKENCECFNKTMHDEENNDGPPELVKIVRNELNDSFDAGRDANNKTTKKSKQSRRKKNDSKITIAPLEICSKIQNTRIKYDENGDPVLNLRPGFGNVSSDKSGKIFKDPDDTDKSVEENDNDDPFILVQSNKRKKRLQKVDSVGSDIVSSKVIKSSRSVSSSPVNNSADQTFIFTDKQSSTHETSPRITKYFAQRYRLFSKYDEGIMMDEESW